MCPALRVQPGQEIITYASHRSLCMSQCSRHSQCVTTDLHTTRFSLNYKIYFKLAAISAF